MEEFILNQLTNINVGQLIAIFAGMYIMHKSISKELKEIRSDVHRIDKKLSKVEGILEHSHRNHYYQPRRYK